MAHSKENTSPKTVKHQVGDVLKSNGTYAKMLDSDGRRCWTLNYAEQDGIGFHMDILPSIPEYPTLYMDCYRFSNAIAVTNKIDKSDAYNWTSSNPKDFAHWFFEKNRTIFESIAQSKKQAIYENYRQDKLFSSLKDIPDIHVKTPLQRAIQLLKRHRDIRFCNQQNEKCKPISMIITSLAAQAYKNELTISDTIRNLIEILSRHAEQINPNFQYNESKVESIYPLITRKENGEWYIPNPINPQENFADKWHETENGITHARAKAFFQWIEWAKEDFIEIGDKINEDYYINALIPSINTPLFSDQLNTFSLYAPHCQKPHWPIILYYHVCVSAKYKFKDSWCIFNSGEQLGKHLKLLFTGRTNTPPPFQVYWQVVNTGDEARDAKGLRGVIFPSRTSGIGGLTQRESTLYIGTHWIECFIVKDNICIARSGKFIVRIV